MWPRNVCVIEKIRISDVASAKSDPDVADFCSESGQSKTVAIERAVNLYIDEYNKKMELVEIVKP